VFGKTSNPVGRSGLVALALTMTIGVAAADEQPETSRAVNAGREGISLYRDRRWAEAYDRFAVADRTAHSPVFVLFMARCRLNLGRLLEAKELFARVANEQLAPDATEPMRRAKEDATDELAALAGRIPSIVVRTTRQRATLTIDGSSRGVAVGAPMELDPGQHTVELRADDGRMLRRVVVLSERGGFTTVDLDEERPAKEVSASADVHRGAVAPAIIALGLGAVGIGVGTVAGLLAIDRANAAKAGCDGDSCLLSDASTAADARRLATVSTIGFVVGGVGAVAGVLLLVVRPGGRSSRGAKAALLVTPVGARVVGAL
jgi:hypothetical protein